VDQRKSTPKNRVFRAEKSQSREKTRFCRAGVKKWGARKITHFKKEDFPDRLYVGFTDRKLLFDPVVTKR
jgi:hypothetical protein